MTTKPFAPDIESIKKRARAHIMEGAVTDDYKADRTTVIEALNQALATEIVCTLRYRSHYYLASGIHSRSVREEFLEHANEEQLHADMIAERITQLDGKPNFSPHGLAERAHSEFVEASDIVEMIKEDLVAERVAIELYREIIAYLGDDDPTSRRLIESILEQEEEHAEDLKTMLGDLREPGAGKAVAASKEPRRPPTPPTNGRTTVV